MSIIYIVVLQNLQSVVLYYYVVLRVIVYILLHDVRVEWTLRVIALMSLTLEGFESSVKMYYCLREILMQNLVPKLVIGLNLHTHR